MTTPKYVIEMMERAKYEFDCFKNNENYATGYTIKIRKATPYTKVDTLKAEIERLKKVGREKQWRNDSFRFA